MSENLLSNETYFASLSDDRLLRKSRILLATLKRRNQEIERFPDGSVKDWHIKDREKTNELLLGVNEELEKRGLKIPT